MLAEGAVPFHSVGGLAEDTSYPNPGDLIEIKGQGYQHWALYVGDGYVIHVTAADGKGPPRSDTTETILTGMAKVKKELLEDHVAKKDEWCVNNKHDWYRPPFPLEDIIERAESWIDKEVPYDELGSNCERFMTTLRYGEGISDQVRHLLAARCSPRGWDTACTLHGDSQGPGVGSKAALPLGCPQPLHLEGHCALSAP
uniref:LRAT domain-containing protein n=1 Tax=Malurus cyaneus samueli TaxID=2593467 RepID=A0A8C5UQS6_9PASS